MAPGESRRFCVAPLMDVTTLPWRALARCMSAKAQVFSEMAVDSVIFERKSPSLPVDPLHQPTALQLGGSDPTRLARAASLCDSLNAHEVNLNVGCPSPRVASSSGGCFGAALMREPELVGEILRRMNESTDCDVSIKTRIGVSGSDCSHFDYNEMANFVSTVSDASGVRIFDMHARIAVLNGLSPSSNRNASRVPLRHAEVHRLKRDFPSLFVSINGGIESYESARDHLQHDVDGVMVGRWPMNNPYCLARADTEMFHADGAIPSREDVLERFAPFADGYLADSIARGGSKPSSAFSALAKALHNLYAGVPGKSKRFRNALESRCQRVRNVRHDSEVPPFSQLLHEAQEQCDARVKHQSAVHGVDRGRDECTELVSAC